MNSSTVQILKQGVLTGRLHINAVILGLLIWGINVVPGEATGPADKLRLPGVFGDNMVLQRDQPVPVWGWAAPGKTIDVRLGKHEAKAIADKDGQWLVKLPPLPAGGPHELTVSDSATLCLTNVMIGEVWLCSGQSNMEMPLSNTHRKKSLQLDCPDIRLFVVPEKLSLEPLDDVSAGWKICAPSSALPFSAVGFHFGRCLHQELGVPIGLMQAAVAGSRAEAWTSEEALEAIPELKPIAIGEFRETVRNMPALEKEYKRRKAARSPEACKEALDHIVAVEADTELARRLASPELDTSDWPDMDLPNQWEKAGLPRFDGMVWFRREIDLPAAWKGRELRLFLGPIDEIDVAWFDGVEVGRTGSLKEGKGFWAMPRDYRIPGKLVVPGKHVIAVRVIDRKMAGGLWGKDADKMRLEPLAASGVKKDSISLAGKWKYQAGPGFPEAPGEPPFWKRSPTGLFNAMINPLIPYGIRGVIWYQGEANAGYAWYYRRLFPTLIEDWRDRWGEGDFPFLFVQLANLYGTPEEPQDDSWAELREAQLKTLSVTNTGMAVTVDIGDAESIHPRNKRDVGERLARWALARVYGVSNLVYSGPLYDSMTIEGDRIRLRFKYVGSGLSVKGDTLKQFAIAGADRKFHWAKAELDGNTVLVWSEDVPAPVAVRYAWCIGPDGCNLYNKEGLPASPFRTDDWPGITGP